MDEKITIIGAGISGITTALTLQVLGYKTEIYADKLVGGKGNSDPRFASAYPAASVIPHSVKSDRLGKLFSQSQQVFETLYNRHFPSLKLHRHYEVYEIPVDEPEYTSYIKNYTPVRDIDKALVPSLDSEKALHGWGFDCYVAEFPVYINQLYERYKQHGGTIYKRKLHRDDVRNWPSDVIINCTGVWSRQLFDDPCEPKIIRGHMVEVPEMSKVKDQFGRICSYNYTPQTDIYATPGGEPCDVYFYPIGDKWLIGGSRQTGSLDKAGKWKGKSSDVTIAVDDYQIPPQILELNKAILEYTYGILFHPRGKLKSKIGYRFVRNDTNSGLRLEKTDEYGKKVIHNYGHGGAGVTLSWGCALYAAKLLDAAIEAERVVDKLMRGL